MGIKIQKAPDFVGVGKSTYKEHREAAMSLKVGEAFLWKNPPTNPRQTVASWKCPNGIIRARHLKGEVWVTCVPF